MFFKPFFLSFLLFLVPSLTLAQDADSQVRNPGAQKIGADTEIGADASEPVSEPVSEPASEPATEPGAAALAFDPASVGLPEFPQPMRSAEDFQAALALIDARIAVHESTLAQIQAEAERVATEIETGESEEDDQGAAAMAQPDIEATATRIERLRELRMAVQRRATLVERLATSEIDLARQREQLVTLESSGVSLEPPYPISLLDQYQAELGLKQAMETVAETRLETAKRRLAELDNALNAAVSARRMARDQFTAAEEAAQPQAERAAVAGALELARLQELLVRQQRKAAESMVTLARNDDHLAEGQQRLLAARVAFLEARAELTTEMLEQRLAEMNDAKEAMRTRVAELQRQGDLAESKLYQAQQRLASAGEDTDTAALEAWVTAHQDELDATRSGVDSLTSAMSDLNQMQQLWQLRFELMQLPDRINAAERLRDLINAIAVERTAKNEIEGRLNALRTAQLAHSRALRDPALSAEVRKAMEARGAAQELAERQGRELLETKDELIALLQGMRHQLEGLVENQTLSLQLLQAQETLSSWWDAEVIVIKDQSIRLRELAIALAMFALVLVVLPMIRLIVRRALRKFDDGLENNKQTDLRLALAAVTGKTSQLFVLIAAFYVAMVFSGLASPTVKDWLWTALVIAFYLQLGIWANAAVVDYLTRRRTRREMRDPSTVTGYGLLMFFVRVAVWITVVVSLLAYFKYPIAGLVGALGVGSLAVAFAVQNILGDVFSSMAIILDKPFRVGDFVKAGDTVGTIELIGVKTSRIRSLSGEQVVLSNSDLLSCRIHNFKHFRERRVVFGIGVVYDTPRDLLERIPDMIRQAIEEQARTRFDRAHFFEFGDFSLNFEVVYFVLSPDYALYMDIQQGINLGIHRRFEEAGIDFAYPTQELIVRRKTAKTVS